MAEGRRGVAEQCVVGGVGVLFSVCQEFLGCGEGDKVVFWREMI